MWFWCFEILRDTTIVLGEKYGVEWGEGIPISTTWRIWDLDVDEPSVLFPFRELIGALLWIALLSRPYIVNAVRAVARYCSVPKMVHWKAVLGILGYAVRTSSFGITFPEITKNGYTRSSNNHFRVQLKSSTRTPPGRPLIGRTTVVPGSGSKQSGCTRCAELMFRSTRYWLPLYPDLVRSVQATRRRAHTPTRARVHTRIS